jgi:hypothetical protein
MRLFAGGWSEFLKKIPQNRFVCCTLLWSAKNFLTFFKKGIDFS